jgi:hypothetical protein
MKVQEIRNDYYEASGVVSLISRQLNFAGIAVIWLLKVGTNSGGISFSGELLVPLYCFVAALGADLLQYVYKTITLGTLNYFHWRKHKDNEADVDVSPKINWLTNIFFWGKVTLLIYGYILLLYFIQGKL